MRGATQRDRVIRPNTPRLMRSRITQEVRVWIQEWARRDVPGPVRPHSGAGSGTEHHSESGFGGVATRSVHRVARECANAARLIRYGASPRLDDRLCSLQIFRMRITRSETTAAHPVRACARIAARRPARGVLRKHDRQALPAVPHAARTLNSSPLTA